MTNPYQHGSSGFAAGESLGSAGLPPLNARRTSYASVVSGTPSSAAAAPRPTRSGFSHLLNPSPENDQQAHQASNVSAMYNAASNGRVDAGMTHPRNGTSADAAPSPVPHWEAPRTSGSLPWFNRAFDIYMAKQPLMVGGVTGEDGLGYGGVPGAGTPGFMAPSYLRGSVYLHKLEETHRAKVLAEREGHTAAAQQASNGLAGSNGASNGNTSSQSISKPSGGSHRGVAYDVVEKPLHTREDEPVSPLPSKWNREDKDGALEVTGDGYEVKYTGRPTGEHEASAIRADNYMSSLCGVYYFEIKVLSSKKREDTTIVIGFSSKSVALTRAPGWEPESWGYHGDDGHCFAAQNVGKSYGPKFGPGDTVGCLINFRLGQVLFTKNGKDLDVAFRDVNFQSIKGKLYPTVGLKKSGDHIYANFGQLPFLFDIDGYMKEQQTMISDQIKRTDTSGLAPPLQETDLIQQLVLHFLQHDGYVETARAFAEEIHAEKLDLRLDPQEKVPGVNIKDDEDANNRQRIRRAILAGDIDEAMAYTDKYYESVLRDNEQVYFRLRCRKFIEMIRREAELSIALEQRKGPKKVHGNAGFEDEEMLEATAFNEDSMDVVEDTDMEGLTKLSQEALAYGMELRTEFCNDPRRETAKHLDEISALIAYPNPLKVKEVAHLLDGSGRVAVAEELNSAILMSLGKSSRSALENLYAQTSVLLEDLRKDGGDGAFVTVKSVIDTIPPSTLF